MGSRGVREVDGLKGEHIEEEAAAVALSVCVTQKERECFRKKEIEILYVGRWKRRMKK